MAAVECISRPHLVHFLCSCCSFDACNLLCTATWDRSVLGIKGMPHFKQNLQGTSGNHHRLLHMILRPATIMITLRHHAHKDS
jgi:hypothetical protein